MRRAAKADRNQVEIVAALRVAGAKVLHLHRVGQGCPDLLVLAPSSDLVLLEVKAEGGTLTPDEREFAARWPVCIVRDVAEALAAIGR